LLPLTVIVTETGPESVVDGRVMHTWWPAVLPQAGPITLGVGEEKAAVPDARISSTTTGSSTFFNNAP
jgi:hypothetical protein